MTGRPAVGETMETTNCQRVRHLPNRVGVAFVSVNVMTRSQHHAARLAALATPPPPPPPSRVPFGPPTPIAGHARPRGPARCRTFFEGVPHVGGGSVIIRAHMLALAGDLE